MNNVLELKGKRFESGLQRLVEVAVHAMNSKITVTSEQYICD